MWDAIVERQNEIKELKKHNKQSNMKIDYYLLINRGKSKKYKYLSNALSTIKSKYRYDVINTSLYGEYKGNIVCEFTFEGKVRENYQ